MQTAVLILISSGVALLMTKTNSAPVMSLYFHPNNGDLICSCDSLDEIRYWSVKNGGCDRVLKYLASLTEKIRDELKQEMEEKMDQNVRELRDSIKVMMSKLAEKNLELQIDIEELSKLQPPSEQPPSDATGTRKQPPSDAIRASNSSP
ncbi:hypothetical protein AgCh_003610 [Apium graveolens]